MIFNYAVVPRKCIKCVRGVVMWHDKFTYGPSQAPSDPVQWKDSFGYQWKFIILYDLIILERAAYDSYSLSLGIWLAAVCEVISTKERFYKGKKIVQLPPTWRQVSFSWGLIMANVTRLTAVVKETYVINKELSSLSYKFRFPCLVTSEIVEIVTMLYK